jgi:hypothetical protein
VSNGGACCLLSRLPHIPISTILPSLGSGFTVSACANRAPEGLIGAALPEVGVHDLLKVCDLLDTNVLFTDTRTVPELYTRFINRTFEIRII